MPFLIPPPKIDFHFWEKIEKVLEIDTNSRPCGDPRTTLGRPSEKIIIKLRIPNACAQYRRDYACAVQLRETRRVGAIVFL